MRNKFLLLKPPSLRDFCHCSLRCLTHQYTTLKRGRKLLSLGKKSIIKYQFCRYLVNIFCVSEHSQAQCFLNFNVHINNLIQRTRLGVRVLHIQHAPWCRPGCRSSAHTVSSQGEPTQKIQITVGDRILMINLHTCCLNALGFMGWSYTRCQQPNV